MLPVGTAGPGRAGCHGDVTSKICLPKHQDFGATASLGVTPWVLPWGVGEAPHPSSASTGCWEHPILSLGLEGSGSSSLIPQR